MRSNFHSVKKSGSTRTTSGKKDAIKHGGSSLNCGDKRARWRPQRQWTRRALQNRSGAKKHLTAHRLWLCKLALVVTDYYPKFRLFQRPGAAGPWSHVRKMKNWNWKAYQICFHFEWTAWNFFEVMSTFPKFKVPDWEKCNCSVRPGAHWEARAIRTMPKQRL